MKNAVLLHGTGGSDTDYFWFADTKRYLEGHMGSGGFHQPYPEFPKLKELLKV